MATRNTYNRTKHWTASSHTSPKLQRQRKAPFLRNCFRTFLWIRKVQKSWVCTFPSLWGHQLHSQVKWPHSPSGTKSIQAWAMSHVCLSITAPSNTCLCFVCGYFQTRPPHKITEQRLKCHGIEWILLPWSALTTRCTFARQRCVRNFLWEPEWLGIYVCSDIQIQCPNSWVFSWSKWRRFQLVWDNNLEEWHYSQQSVLGWGISK